MDIVHYLIDWVLHLDVHLQEIITNYRSLTYLILFIIIFAETGFVVTPFLPGDSLLFAAGALSVAEGNGLNVHLLVVLMIIAALGGNQVNYAVGRWIGPKIFERDYRLIKRSYLERTQRFYERHGGQAIIYSRFIPIIRTFAPFVAGIGGMNAGRFAVFNAIGGIAWVALFTYVGYFFGNQPAIKNNFHIVIFGIIAISLLPPVIAFIRLKMESRKQTV